MKLALKILGVFFLALIVLLGVLGKIILSSHDKYSPGKVQTDNIMDFESQIERANRDCPIPAANGVGEVTSITLEDQSLTFRITYKDEWININAFRNNPEATKAMFYLSFVAMRAQGSHVERLIDELLARGLGIRIICYNESGKSFTSILSPEYIKEMNRQIKLNPSEALHDALALKLKLEYVGFPIQIAAGMVMTGMHLEGNNIVVDMSVSEKLYDLDVIESNSTEIINSIMEDVNAGDPYLGAIFDLCKISHTGIIYRTTGMSSYRIVDTVIPSEFIRRNRITPSSVKIN